MVIEKIRACTAVLRSAYFDALSPEERHEELTAANASATILYVGVGIILLAAIVHAGDLPPPRSTATAHGTHPSLLQ